jgi:photosystem II stability/assembly factor-like uncharacterized protein
MKKVFFAFAILALFADFSAAQEWVQTNGPSGNGVQSIVFNKKKDMFVLSDVLLRTTDQGASWMVIGPETRKESYNGIAISATSDIYVLTYDGFTYPDVSILWKSSDNGMTWSQALRRTNLINLMTSPDSTIYVATGALNANGGNQNFSILRTRDNGVTWDSTFLCAYYSLNPAFGVDVHGVAFYSTQQNVFRSTDKGRSWSIVTKGLTGSDFRSFSFAAGGDDYLIALGGGNYGFLRSTDGGSSWQRILNLLGESDGWEHTCSVDRSGRILLAAEYDMGYSDDSCKSWHDYGKIRYDSGYTIIPWYFSVAGPDSGFYVTADQSIFYSNHLNKWTRLSIPISHATKLISAPNGNIISSAAFNINYAGGYNPSTFWYSSDQGSNWKIVTTLNGQPILPMPVHYAVARTGLVAITNGGMYKSTNSGANWVQSGTEPGNDLSSILVDHNGYFFTASLSRGIFRSRDSGITWDTINKGITDKQIYSLANDSRNDIFAGTNGAIYKTTDVGKTWKRITIDSGKAKVNCMTVDDEGNILAGTAGDGIFLSRDTGLTWSSFNLGLPAPVINDLQSTISGTIFAATDSGVFKRDSGASAWNLFSLGLATKKIWSLTVDPEGRLYAGSDGSGVFRSSEAFSVAHGLTGWIDVEDIDFDSVLAGGEVCKDMLIRNAGAAPFILKGFSVKDPIQFSVDTQSIKLPVTLQPNTSISVRVCFHPPQIGTYASEIDWNTDLDASVSGVMKGRSLLHGFADSRSAVVVTQSKLHIILHPNPASGNVLTLSFSEAPSQAFILSVYDVLGREVYRNNIMPGLKEFDIPIRDQSEGVFYVRIESNGVTTTKQFVKVK